MFSGLGAPEATGPQGPILVQSSNGSLGAKKGATLTQQQQDYNAELRRIKKSSVLAKKLNIEVHAGHGLDYQTTKILSKINEIQEFNIGHFIIGESIFFGLSTVIRNFKKIIKK